MQRANVVSQARRERARAIVRAGGIRKAVDAGTLPQRIDIALSEAIVLGLVEQEVRLFLCVLGHGSTEVGEVLRAYEAEGLVRTCAARSEIEASHASTALRWVTGEKAAVVTSIGPGALQALAASLAPASNRIGVWYLLGDETTEDEGPNMQQIPGHAQGGFLKLFSAMGPTYSLHTPQALPTALRRGLNTVDHPHRAGPFYLLMPMNTQPAALAQFNLDELPGGFPSGLGPAVDNGAYEKAARILAEASRPVLRVGGGARGAGPELLDLLEAVDGVAVVSPLVSGVIPYDHPRNMTVGGSKGSICGNYAMEQADVLVTVGSRSACQSDCSRTGYPQTAHVININTDPDDATHYGKTLALVGDARATLEMLFEAVKAQGRDGEGGAWLKRCTEKRLEWEAFKEARYSNPTLYDEVWQAEVLTQPAAIKAATDWARARDVVAFFDAGDVQANGFQIVEDDRLGRTFTDTGASYMGFAVSALLATGLASQPFYGLALTGDGSFTMSPQILIDGAQHGARGCVLLLDNRRMAAISGLQMAQYGADHATNDSVAVDYIGWARSVTGVEAFDGGRTTSDLVSALDRARAHDGLSLVHVPVYYGDDELGGMGAYGRWNVGNWCEETQRLRHDIGL
jgi:3D-(3,5/4)-trihydroxycyclohexane-1,2-dione acylhydrolase (decyclizing)